ncbi:MAG: ImmA/IrrE family metallo-endopeptidase [Aequorivita sp.]
MNKLIDERELLSKPGDTILETIEYIGMSQVELADRMGKTPPKINDLISGKEPITLTTALQLEKVLGIDSQFWMNREMLFREKLLRLQEQEDLETYKSWLSIQPIKILKSLGYLKSKTIGTSMIEECLKFYGVASPTQWESVYINQYLSTSFRKSDAHRITLGGLATFLRIGEIEMLNLNLDIYDKKAFKDSFSDIKKLVIEHPQNFAERLKDLCANAGVALIYTANIPKAPISGVARWVNGTPLIQLTDRYKSNDHFWFSFFHEAGHILLHGKKDIFIEDSDDYKNDTKKELEANEFANKILLPIDINAVFPKNLSEKDIRKLARDYNTHPAIVVGQLQRQKIIPYTFGNSLKLKINLDKVIKKR